MLIARFDGACDPNPLGHCSCACLIERDGAEVHRESRYLGNGQGMTNNVAEYEGLLLILRWFNRQVELGHRERLLVIGDSMLVINCMGRQKMRPSSGVCAASSQKCIEAATIHKPMMTFQWQPRQHNEECDAMCQLEIGEAKCAKIRD